MEIQLLRGQIALVDADKYDVATQYTWYLSKRPHTSYAITTVSDGGKRSTLYLHKLILPAPLGMVIDHVNGDGLDNRLCNLQVCTPAQNRRKSKVFRNNTSGYVGVSWNSRDNLWQSAITLDGKRKFIGYFSCKHEAAEAYNVWAKRSYGDYAQLNNILAEAA